MTLYRLELKREVQKQVDALPSHLRQRVKQILRDLTRNPRPTYAEELRDELAQHYKIKPNDWRIVYRIQDDRLLVLVLKVGKKKGPEFYHGLA
jgi:mRNA interferase RelE/StbE